MRVQQHDTTRAPSATEALEMEAAKALLKVNPYVDCFDAATMRAELTRLEKLMAIARLAVSAL